MTMPSWPWAMFVMIHTDLVFSFFTALLNRPTHSWRFTQLREGMSSGLRDAPKIISFYFIWYKTASKTFCSPYNGGRSCRMCIANAISARTSPIFSGTFTLYELERTCMGVSRDMVRKVLRNVLRNLQKAGFVECLGRGPGAVWRKMGNTLKKG